MGDYVQIHSGSSLTEYDYLLKAFRMVVSKAKHGIRISRNKQRLIIKRYTDYRIKLENYGSFKIAELKAMNREYRHIKRYPKK